MLHSISIETGIFCYPRATYMSNVAVIHTRIHCVCVYLCYWFTYVFIYLFVYLFVCLFIYVIYLIYVVISIFITIHSIMCKYNISIWYWSDINASCHWQSQALAFCSTTSGTGAGRLSAWWDWPWSCRNCCGWSTFQRHHWRPEGKPHLWYQFNPCFALVWEWIDQIW